jgi:hypothetical protein
MAVAERLTQRNRVFDNTWICVRANPMAIGGRVFLQELGMLLQGATAVVKVVGLDLYAFGRAEGHKFLLHRIPGKTIPDAENTNSKPYCT